MELRSSGIRLPPF